MYIKCQATLGYGGTSDTKFTARLKLAFLGYGFTDKVRADFTYQSCKIVKRTTGKNK